MTTLSKNWLLAVWVTLALFILVSIAAPGLPSIYSNAQGPGAVRRVNVEVVAEEGSPVAVTAARTELDLDPFGAPLAARTYIDYKNVGTKPISGVKFRIRYTDETGKDRGTQHAPDAAVVHPGSDASQKWRTERVDPRTTQVKMRVLAVRYSDGSVWASSKMQEVVKPLQAEPQGAAESGQEAPSEGSDLPQ